MQTWLVRSLFQSALYAFRRSQKGQSILEMAVLTGVIVGIFAVFFAAGFVVMRVLLH
jgi:hypothetical protein